jgi:hypothetical protein
MGPAIIGTMAERAGYSVKILYQESVPVTRDHIMWANLIGFEQENRILTYEWNRFDALNAVFRPKLMSPHELQQATFKAMRQFYSLKEAFRHMLRGRFDIAAIRLYGKVTLARWLANNKRYLRLLNQDANHVFETKKTVVGVKTPLTSGM